MSLRVLTLSTLFPDASRPNFGIFVARQTRELACRPNVEVTVIAPRGIPPWPLSGTGSYRTLAALTHVKAWRGLSVFRSRFPILLALVGLFLTANYPPPTSTQILLASYKEDVFAKASMTMV